eukprot:gene2337-4545_t
MPSKKIRDLKRALRSKGESCESNEIMMKLSVLEKEVKFFERRKLTRKIKSVDTSISSSSASEKELASLSALRKKLEEDLTVWEFDVLPYVLYFPKERKYLSLLSSTDDKQSGTQRDELRRLAVKQRIFEISMGKRDRVQHAIDVEYGVALDDDNDRTESAFPPDAMHEEDEDKRYSINLRKSQDKRTSAGGAVANKTKVRTAGPERAMDDNIGTRAASGMPSTTIGNDGVNIEKEGEDSADDDDVSPDPFFAEEAVDPDAESAVLAQAAQQQTRSTGGRSTSMNRTKSYVRRDVDISGCTKQEARLIQWQARVRGGGAGGRKGWPSSSPRTGVLTDRASTSTSTKGADTLHRNRTEHIAPKNENSHQPTNKMNPKVLGTINSSAPLCNTKRKFDDL